MAVAGAVGSIKVVNGVIVVVGAAPGMTMSTMNGMGSGGGGGAGSGGPAEPAKATAEKTPDPAPTSGKTAPAAVVPAAKPYINNNPKANAGEINIGRFLNEEAQAGRLPGYKEVEGLREVKGQPSPDYGMTKTDGAKIRGDLYQPESANPDSIGTNTIGKSGQADTVVVEFGRGGTKDMDLPQAKVIADRVLLTPGHSITRVIVIKDGVIILNLP